MSKTATFNTLRPASLDEIFDWLLNDTYGDRFIDEVLGALCNRMRAVGISVARATVALGTTHREWLGAFLLWRPSLEKVEIEMIGYEVREGPNYLKNPIRDLQDGSPEIRRRLWMLTPEEHDYSILSELVDEGLTDYLALPLLFTLGQRHVVTFASDAPQGFTDQEIAFFRRIVPLFTLVAEARLKNVILRVLMETYVGPIAAGRILAGDTRRGFGSSIEAATMITDLRQFTDLAAGRPRDQVIELLDDYFEAIADPVERHGGEILKFMGDGMLAVFPLDQPDACTRLIQSVREGQERLAALNEANRAKGLPELHQGVGVHLGTLSYGNIGSRNRLDFTVIGPVVNIAARLQVLARDIGCSVLVSGDFARRAADPAAFRAVGTFPVRGIPDPIEVLELNP